MSQYAFPFGFSNTSPSAVQSGERDERDFYPTPVELVDNALSLIGFTPDLILDPCAGTGNWGLMARARWEHAIIAGVDQFFDVPTASYNVWWNQDFRSLVPALLYDLIMMNPPFVIAQEFIEHARLHLAPHGKLIALVKLNLLCSVGRAETIWREYKPESVHTLGDRPSFSGDGRTAPGEEYMLIVWGKESAPRTELEIGRLWK